MLKNVYAKTITIKFKPEGKRKKNTRIKLKAYVYVFIFTVYKQTYYTKHMVKTYFKLMI